MHYETERAFIETAYSLGMFAAVGRWLADVWRAWPERRAETWRWATPLLF